jgi:hypothetical protein
MSKPPVTTSSLLIYNANTGSRIDQDLREYRFGRRKDARKVSRHERFRKCGCTAHGQVTIGLKNGKAQQRGLYTCGSVWVCPVCSAKILAYRSKEVAEAIQEWQLREGTFVFQTLTLSHRPGDSVAKQRFWLTKAWNSLNKGSFAKIHKGYGQVGYLRATEVTFGSNGPNLHLHVLRFVDRKLSETEVDVWAGALFNKWADSVENLGAVRPKKSAHSFVQTHKADGLSGYFTKNFDNPIKSGLPGKSTSIWALLTKAIEDPSSYFAKAWQAYETGSKGMRQLTWSRNLRAILGMVSEVDDEWIAQEQEPYTPLLEILPEAVKAYGMLGQLQARVLRFVESGDLETAAQILAEHGVSCLYLCKNLENP